MTDRNENITFEIKEHIGVISSYDSGWNRELNIVSWNGGIPKYDIRDWDPDHERMSKGITLLDRDMRAVVDMYISKHNRNTVEQGKAEIQEREERKKSIARPSYGSETTVDEVSEAAIASADEMTMSQVEAAEQ